MDAVLGHVISIDDRMLQLASLPKQLQEGLKSVQRQVQGLGKLMVEVRSRAQVACRKWRVDGWVGLQPRLQQHKYRCSGAGREKTRKEGGQGEEWKKQRATRR
jgi:hypothetical protein